MQKMLPHRYKNTDFAALVCGADGVRGRPCALSGDGIAPVGSAGYLRVRPSSPPMRVLGRLFRRLFLSRLSALQAGWRLAFFKPTHLAGWSSFLRRLSPVRKERSRSRSTPVSKARASTASLRRKSG